MRPVGGVDGGAAGGVGRELSHDRLSCSLAAGRYWFTGKPRFTPPWLGSSQREVTALPLV